MNKNSRLAYHFSKPQKKVCQLEHVADLFCNCVKSCFLCAVRDNCIMSMILIDILEPSCVDGIIMSLAVALI